MPATPPSEWFSKVKPSLRRQYPKYSDERLDKIAAGVWHKKSDSEKQRLTQQLESKGMEWDVPEYWDRLISTDVNLGKQTYDTLEGASLGSDDDAPDAPERKQLKAPPSARVEEADEETGPTPDQEVTDTTRKIEDMPGQSGLTVALEKDASLEEMAGNLRMNRNAPDPRAQEDVRAIRQQFYSVDDLTGEKGFTYGDDNPAQQEQDDEYEWGLDYKKGKYDENTAGKPVIVSFNPPLSTVENIRRAINKTLNVDEDMTPTQRKATWRAIVLAAKNLHYLDNPVLAAASKYYSIREYPQGKVPRLASLWIPLYRVRIKTVSTKGEREYYVEGFVTTPMRDLQNEEISENALKSVKDVITRPPYDLGWLDHKSPYAAPEENQATPPIMRFEEAKILNNPVGKLGLWVRAKINKVHPDFKRVWTELKGGFYNAFSMEFMPLRESKRFDPKEKHPINVVEDVKYLSTSLVRAPANPGAFITKVYAKSFFGTGVRVKDLGRETGTTAPERSNTAIGEWGDPTMEKGRAKLRDQEERLSALNKLKPQTGLPGQPSREIKDVPGGRAQSGKPSSTESGPDKQLIDSETDAMPSPEAPKQTPSSDPRENKSIKHEEEEDFPQGQAQAPPPGGQYGGSPQPPQYGAKPVPRQDEEMGYHEEEEDEEEEMEAYKAFRKWYIAKKRAKREDEDDEARAGKKYLILKKLRKSFPEMNLAQALKAAGEMTDILGEVNAPRKIDREQKPPEVEYGEYGTPDMPEPLSTFGAQISGVVKKAVEKGINEIQEFADRTMDRKTVVRKGRGGEEVNTKSAATQDLASWETGRGFNDDDIESQLMRMNARMGY